MKTYTYNYPMPAVTADCILLRQNKQTVVLLIRRKHDPFMGKWALPGGFVEIDEDLDDGAKRELEEETGVQNITLTQFKTYGKPGRDPRGRTISVVYYGYLTENSNPIKAGDDAIEAAWFDLGELPDLAFDHEIILKEFVEQYGEKK